MTERPTLSPEPTTVDVGSSAARSTLQVGSRSGHGRGDSARVL